MFIVVVASEGVVGVEEERALCAIIRELSRFIATAVEVCRKRVS